MFMTKKRHNFISNYMENLWHIERNSYDKSLRLQFLSFYKTKDEIIILLISRINELHEEKENLLRGRP